MRRILANLWHRLGRRGTFLLFLTVLDLLYGLSLAKPAATARQSPTVHYIAHIAPLAAWAALWLAVGVVCAVGAFARRDQWAFASAMGLKVLWGVTFGCGWAIAGLDRGWVSAVIWLAFAAVVFLIASWPEPVKELDLRRGPP